jgi:hypothetical protein
VRSLFNVGSFCPYLGVRSSTSTPGSPRLAAIDRGALTKRGIARPWEILSLASVRSLFESHANNEAAIPGCIARAAIDRVEVSPRPAPGPAGARMLEARTALGCFAGKRPLRPLHKGRGEVSYRQNRFNQKPSRSRENFPAKVWGTRAKGQPHHTGHLHPTALQLSPFSFAQAGIEPSVRASTAFHATDPVLHCVAPSTSTQATQKKRMQQSKNSVC